MFGHHHHHEHGRHRCRSHREHEAQGRDDFDRSAFESEGTFGQDDDRPDFAAMGEARRHWRAMFEEGRGGERGFRFMRGEFGRGPRGRGGPGGPGGSGGRGPWGRGPGGGRRALEQGDLRWLTLDLIAAEPRHGYEIIKAIEEAFGGHYSPSPGVIYPTLTLLEETGLIAGETQGAKKRYSLTHEGRAELDAHAAEVQAVRDRLEAARARFGDAPAPEVMRAMHNVRAALQVRLAKGDVTPETVRAITTALDRAASEIEGS
ncbi:PadR family transcriptional regulator [Jiella sp. M17.18]|uniref:PadR family transcriptional regulator n=1 Tax=Jiella sp. M17.18 TaxID=3234247 RepID=UPI0034DF0FC1